MGYDHDEDDKNPNAPADGDGDDRAHGTPPWARTGGAVPNTDVAKQNNASGPGSAARAQAGGQGSVPMPPWAMQQGGAPAAQPRPAGLPAGTPAPDWMQQGRGPAPNWGALAQGIGAATAPVPPMGPPVAPAGAPAPMGAPGQFNPLAQRAAQIMAQRRMMAGGGVPGQGPMPVQRPPWGGR